VFKGLNTSTLVT